MENVCWEPSQGQMSRCRLVSFECVSVCRWKSNQKLAKCLRLLGGLVLLKHKLPFIRVRHRSLLASQQAFCRSPPKRMEGDIGEQASHRPFFWSSVRFSKSMKGRTMAPAQKKERSPLEIRFWRAFLFSPFGACSFRLSRLEFPSLETFVCTHRPV